MEPLITRNDIAKYRQISKTSNDAKLNEMILDAQMLDIQPLLGEVLYNKLISEPGNYQSLLAGGTYQHNNVNYTNYGLKMVICYFAYARYVMFGSAIDTPYSVVEKLNDNSRPVETASKKTIYQLNRDAAFQIWDSVSNYLLRTNNTDFKSCHNTPKRTGMRFKKIG